MLFGLSFSKKYQAPINNDAVIDLLERMVDAGRTGAKSGVGFYEHSGRKAVASDLSPFIQSRREDSVPTVVVRSDDMTPIQRRLVYPLINESVRCLHERVVSEAWMADLAMVLGTGFAPFHGGPLSLGQSIGWKKVLSNMRALSVMYGDRFEPAERMTQLAGGTWTLYPQASDRSGFGASRLSCVPQSG